MRHVAVINILIAALLIIVSTPASFASNTKDHSATKILWEERIKVLVDYSTRIDLYKEKTYCTTDRSLYCLSKTTGQKQWEWTSAEYFSIFPGKNHVLINESSFTVCLDANSGKELWRKRGTFDNSPIMLEDSAIIKNYASVSRISLTTGEAVWNNTHGDYYTYEYTPKPSDNMIVLDDRFNEIYIVDILTGETKHRLDLSTLSDNGWILSEVLFRNNRIYFVCGVIPHETSYGFRFVSFGNDRSYWCKLRCFDLTNNTVVWSRDIKFPEYRTEIGFIGNYLKTINNELFDINDGNPINVTNPMMYYESQESKIPKYIGFEKSESEKLNLVCREAGQQEPLWSYATGFKEQPDVKTTTNQTLLTYKQENGILGNAVCLENKTGAVLWKLNDVNGKMLAIDDEAVVTYTENPRQLTSTLECLDVSTGKPKWSKTYPDNSKHPFVLENRIFYVSQNWLLCFDNDNKTKLWDLDFGDQIEDCRLIDSNILIFTKDKIFKISADNGEVVWYTKIQEYEPWPKIFGSYIFLKIHTDNQSAYPPNMFVYDLDSGIFITSFYYSGYGTYRDDKLPYMKWLNKQKGGIRNDGEIIAIEGDYIVIKHSGYGKGEVFSCFNFENDILAWEFRQFDIGDFCFVKMGNAYFTNYGKVTCLDLISGQARWSKKIFDIEQYHWRIDEFGNFYCIGNTKVVSENKVNPKSLICLDEQTGEVAYSYPLKEKPLYFSVSGGLVLLYSQSTISCLKDWNYGRDKPGSRRPPNPILIVGLTLSLVLLAVYIRLVIQRKKDRLPKHFTNTQTDDKN